MIKKFDKKDEESGKIAISLEYKRLRKNKSADSEVSPTLQR